MHAHQPLGKVLVFQGASQVISVAFVSACVGACFSSCHLILRSARELHLTLCRIGSLSVRFSGLEGAADPLGPGKVLSLWDQGDWLFLHSEYFGISGLRISTS